MIEWVSQSVIQWVDRGKMYKLLFDKGSFPFETMTLIGKNKNILSEFWEKQIKITYLKDKNIYFWWICIMRLH